MSDLAGRSNILMKATNWASNSTLILRAKGDSCAHQKMEHEGYEFEAAEGSLALLIRKILKHQEPPFKSRAITSPCDETRCFRVPGQRQSSGGRCHRTYHRRRRRPVNALDQALRSALVKFYPSLKKMRLEDYKVRILDSTSGSSAALACLLNPPTASRTGAQSASTTTSSKPASRHSWTVSNTR